MTKEDYDRQNAKKPKKPTSKEWRDQAEAAKAWDHMRKTYFEAAQNPYRFEEVMLFPDHRFPEPPAPEVRTAKELKQQQKDAFEGFKRRFSEAVRNQARD